MSTKENIIEREFPDVLEENFMSYGKTVIIQRALPDARDGLKPSQRRILVAMDMLHSSPTSNYIKCARISGDTSGKLHPHGEAVVYPTLVSLAQDFKIRYPLIDGQGNFGSNGGDKAAAMRYTEARLSKNGAALIEDLSPDVVPHQANYNDEFQEPSVLPAMFPNLLANGATGIAVGIATKMPSHNYRELVALMKAYKQNPNITTEEMIKIMPGPDFPSGGVILGQSKIKEYYENGKTINGGIVTEGLYTIETNNKGINTIVVTQFPFGGSPEKMSEQIYELIDPKRLNRLEGIRNIHDYSAANTIELQIELDKGANAQIILNKLLKSTCLRTTFDVNATVIVGGTDSANPEEIRVMEHVPLLKLLDIFLDHRQTVLTKKFTSERNKANQRVHILDGLIKISLNIDQAIAIIRSADDADDASAKLISSNLVDTTEQAQAVLSITLRQLTKLEASKLLLEREERLKRIAWLDAILSNSKKMTNFILEEQEALAKSVGDDRRTKIGQEIGKLIDEDLIPKEEIIVSLTKDGYIKRMPLNAYRVQLRGGKGVKGVGKREDDEAADIFVANSHDSILFFTTLGMAYRKRGYEIPEASKTSRGVHRNNLLSLSEGEEITNTIPLGSLQQDGYLLMITRKGLIKKTEIKEYDTSLKTKGLSAIKLVGDDTLAFVEATDGTKDVLIATANGKAIRYNESEVRSTGRSTQGVKALSLKNNDTIAQLLTLDTKEEPSIMVVTSRGFAKKSPSSEYRARTGRGGSGVDTISRVSADRNGLIAGAVAVTNDDTIFILTAKGKIIQVSVNDFRTTGRTTMGVKVVDLDPQDSIVSIAKVTDGILPEEEETS